MTLLSTLKPILIPQPGKTPVTKNTFYLTNEAHLFSQLWQGVTYMFILQNRMSSCAPEILYWFFLSYSETSQFYGPQCEFSV